jgi:hypothetical protein
MARPSKLERTWSDAQLTDAVADFSNWRAVIRKLGLRAAASGRPGMWCGGGLVLTVRYAS